MTVSVTGAVTGAGGVAAVLLAAAPMSSTPGPVPSVSSVTVCTITDRRIDEASGLVDLGRWTVVANDSGDGGVLYVLDRRCRVVGTTTYDDPDGVRDVEALAPAGSDTVWVGDIGDNARVRDEITVRRVSIGPGERRVSAPSYRLVYPDGPHDAETLLAQPGTGRLFVVAKQSLRAEVFAAPARLDPAGPNRLTKVASVSLLATDGSFLPDGRVLLRGYPSVSLYTLPDWDLVTTWRLPAQPQGEALSGGPGGRVRIVSEGRDQPLLQVDLTRDTREREPTGGSSADTSDPEQPRDESAQASSRTPLLAGGAAAVAVVLGVWLVWLVWRRRRGQP